MPVLHRDLETYSVVKLKDAGHWRYAADPTTRVLCYAFAVDDDPVQLWTPGQKIPEEFVEAGHNPDWLVVAHNDAFESAIEELVLAPQLGWPLIPRVQHRCSQAVSLASAMPGALEKVADALDLPQKKDPRGKRILQKMARGKELTKEELELLYEYCRQDVEVERAVYKRLPPLSPAEQELWALDQTVNRRGFLVDHALALAAHKIEQQEKSFHKQKLAELTGGKITSVGQIKRMKALLAEHGCEAKSLGKGSIESVIAQAPDNVRPVIELRRDGAKASKLKALFAGIDADSRIRGTLQFHGAATGRWAGRRFQPQNLKKEPKIDVTAAIAAVGSGDLERVRGIGPPLSVISDISRSMICAAPGHVLMGADFSAIESRVLAWLACEEWKLDSYRRYDETGDSALEPYCVTATRILGRTVTRDDKAERQIGKICDLAFGFGGTLQAWRKFDTTHSDAAVDRFCAAWRRGHKATVRFWHALENGLRDALRTGERGRLRALAFDYADGTLYLTLPSGRRLAYPEAQLKEGERGPYIAFKGYEKGKWQTCRGWFGIFTENVVSAVSRDLLAAAMQRAEASGYRVILHVHDELICEIPAGFGDLKQFRRLVTELPQWAEGLPVAAEPWTGTRYLKTAPAPEPAAPYVNGFHVLPDPPAEEPIVAPASSPLAQLVGGKINCPFHDDDTPSLHVYEDHYHCFGCGAHGDLVDLLVKIEGMSSLDAEQAVAAYTPGSSEHHDYLPQAMRYWNAAQPIAGTLAERYLADIRKIDVSVLPADVDLRFHPRCYFNGDSLPCMIALLRDSLTDEPTGIHRVALTPEVFAGGKVERRLLGRQGRGVVKLWPAGAQLVVGEGIETVLAAATRLSQRPAWSAISAPMLEKFPVLPGVEQLVILVDHDDAGKQAAGKCMNKWRCAGRHVRQLMPRAPGTDFNDLIKGDAS
jgi:DNA polymerase